MVESLRKNERVVLEIDTTIADGLAVNQVGVNTFHNAKGIVDKMVTIHYCYHANCALRTNYNINTLRNIHCSLQIVVKEDWVARAIMHIVEEEKFVVEGGGAVAMAAIMAGLFPNLKGKK